MSKSVLMSIHPEYCHHIADGRKIIEIRKSRPMCLLPVKVYIYCTKGKDNPIFIRSPGLSFYGYRKVIIGEFICSKIEQFHMDDDSDYEISDDDLLRSCLSRTGLKKYGNGSPLYMWHISDLLIYDNPKELSAFGKSNPPQSWYYVNEEGSSK